MNKLTEGLEDTWGVTLDAGIWNFTATNFDMHCAESVYFLRLIDLTCALTTSLKVSAMTRG